MSDGESASIQFEEETDDDTVDFHTEVDNQSIISQRVANAGGRSSRRAASPAVSNTPKTQATPPATQQQSAPLVASVPSQPVAAPQATVVTPATKSAATDTDTSDDEVDPDASPRMMTTSTGKLNRGGAAAEKKTVVSATLRARAASQARGRSPNVPAPETAVTSVPRSAPLAQSSSSSASHTAAPATSSPPAVRGASPVGDAVPNVPMGATTTLDAAGVAALLQFISAGQQSHRGGSPQPQLGSNAGAVASAIETAQIATLNYETLQRHIQTQQQLQVPPVAPHATVSAVTANGPQLATNAAPPPLQQSPGLTPQALASSRARRIAASNDIVASAPPTELADDAREEAARITLGWYRDFNGEQRKQLQALEARVREEKFALQSDMMAFRDRKASEAQQRTFAADAAVREREQLHTTTRAASKKHARAASAHPAAPSPRVEAPPRPVALEPSLEAVVRGVASRYGVVLPAPNLTGSTETAVSLPDRLFFATGVQLTRDQRNELLVKMREAIRLRGSGTSAPNAVGPVPWLAPVDTELGSRAASLPRAALDNKTRISMSPGRGVLAGASAERPSPPDSMPRGVSVADWTPFTGPMRQRTREGGPAAIPRQTSTQQRIADVGGPRPRKRTEVLRDIFLLLDVRNRKLLRRAEMELLYQELSLEDESRRADDLKYSKASARLHRDLTLRFVVEYVLPLMLLSGFEEFDFPLFSQIILRMADKVALPTDFAFQPTAQSPLASRGRRGESLGEVDIASTSQAVTEYLRALCAVPSA